MGNWGNNDDFDVTIQPDDFSGLDSVSPAIEQGSGGSTNTEDVYSLQAYFGNRAEQTGGGITQQSEQVVNTNTYTTSESGLLLGGSGDIINLPDEVLNEETLEAISNSYASAAFNLIARRGINPIRAEVLGVHEFVPIAKGEDFTVDQSSITLNFGADNPTVVVNQVVRLIELHRTLIQTANLLAEQLIVDASGFTKDQIDGGILRAHYDMTNVTGYFDSVFEAAYPYGSIFDSDVEVILNKFVDGFFQVKDSGQYPFTIGLINLEPYSLSESAINFGFLNLDQLDSNLISSENKDNEFSKTAVKIAIIKTLIPAIVTYIKEIVSLQSTLNSALNFANLDLNAATDNSDNYSKIISICTGQNYGGLTGVTSFLDFGTGVSNAAGSNNTINFLNVVSKLYTECMFIRNHPPGDYVGAVGISSNYDYVNETITDQVILSSMDSNAKKIRHGIEKLKRFKPYTSNMYNPGLLNGSNQDAGSTFYSDVNGDSDLYDYDSYGSSLSESNVNSMLNAVDGSTDQALAELIAAICYDQVVGANVNLRQVSSNIRPAGVGENNGTGLFPALNILRGILYKDPAFFSTATQRYQNYRSAVFKESDNDLNGIFSNLTEFAQLAIGLNIDPNNPDGRFVPLEYSNDLTDEKKNAAKFIGPVRLGAGAFILDAVTEDDTILSTLDSFISEFESEFKKVRNFIIDYYSLGFDFSSSDGVHDSDFGSAGKINSPLNPLSYFYWYMDLLADELEDAINRLEGGPEPDSGHQQEAFLLGLFAESGKDVESMIKSFKSAYFGFLVAKQEYSVGGLTNITMEREDVNALYQMFCYRTDLALRSLFGGFFSGAGGLKTGDTEFNSINDEFTSLLTNGINDLTNDEFEDAPGSNKRFGYNNTVAYPGSSPDFQSLGTRVGAKNNLGHAVGIYDSGRDGAYEDDTFARDLFGGYNGRLRGIRPSFESTYLHHVMRNTPIVSGLASAVSEVKFQDHFLNTATNVSKDRPVANPGQFGGIFSTSSFQRALIFYMWAMRIYKKGVSVNFDLNVGNQLRYNPALYFARGTIQALKRALMTETDGWNQNNDRDAAIEEGFSNTAELMSMVKDAIRVKRHNILQPLAFFEKVIENLKEFRNSAQDNLNVSISLNSDSRNYLAGSLIRRIGFLDEGNLVALNNVTAASLHKSLTNHFQAPVDTNISKLVSVYDSFAVNDVKLMYKVLSQPGYGLNSDENFGKKDIIHVGIPAGMLTALQSMSFDASNDTAFQSATKIAIHVVKRDEINPDVIFHPRTFVFDMERFILPKGPTGFASNHVANYSDSWSFLDILFNMQVYHSFGGGLDDGRLGETYGGISIPSSLEYSLNVNHLFDYYLKMYCRLTTGLDYDEETFKVFSSKLFNGSVDANMQQFFNDYTNSLVQLYPSANVNPDSAIAFTRALNVSKNYTIFAPFARLESALSVNCFDRVFSIMINERDFTAPVDLLYGASSTDVFVENPSLHPDGRTQVPPVRLSAPQINIADGQSLFDSSAELSDKLDEYLKGLDPNSTHVSKYSIHISLLKI